MGYPDPPDFRSGEPLAAWFLINLGEGRTLGVATQGETANKRIQRALNEYSAGRSSVFGAPLTVDGIIGDRTLAALEVAAREHEAADPGGGYGQIRSVIQGDRRARRISPLSYRWGLWLAYVRPDATMRGRTYGDVVVPANAQYPLFGQAPDDDRDAGGANLQAVTWLLNVQDPPRPPSRSQTRTPVGSPAPQTVTTGREPGTTGTTGAPSSSTGAIAPAPSGTLSRTSTAATSILETQYAGVAGKWWLLGALAVGAGYLAMKGGGGGRRRRSGRAAMLSGSRARRASRRYSRRRAR